MRECIESVLVRLVDHDGYKSAKNLKSLIDGAMKTLESGYPEKLVDYKEREVCPLCFHRFKED